VTASLLDKVAKAWQSYADSIQRFCASRQVPYFRAATNLAPEELVLEVFRRGGFLR
jgi:hypothetical protein